MVEWTECKDVDKMARCRFNKMTATIIVFTTGLAKHHQDVSILGTEG